MSKTADWHGLWVLQESRRLSITCAVSEGASPRLKFGALPGKTRTRLAFKSQTFSRESSLIKGPGKHQGYGGILKTWVWSWKLGNRERMQGDGGGWLKRDSILTIGYPAPNLQAMASCWSSRASVSQDQNTHSSPTSQRQKVPTPH